MLLAAGGEFILGSEFDGARENEYPPIKVTVSPFYIDQHEVTNKQFAAFVKATGHITTAEKPLSWEDLAKGLPPGTAPLPDSLLAAGSMVFSPTEQPVNLRDYSQWWRFVRGAFWRQPAGPGSSIEDKLNHPVVHISYEDALAYATWAGKDLPTEAEWEYAAKAGKSGQKYPWGNEAVFTGEPKANTWDGEFPWQNEERDGHYLTAPIMQYPPNPLGLYDMAGNVWEWTKDLYHAHHRQELAQQPQPINNPTGASSSYDPDEPYETKRVQKGGSYLCNEAYCSSYRSSARMPGEVKTSLQHLGFRCVLRINNSELPARFNPIKK